MRACSGYYSAARQLQVFTGGAPGNALTPANPLYALERALATATHHDAVTGTERQHVAYDYALQLARGRADAALGVAAALASLTGYAPPAGGAGWAACELANATISCASLEAGAPTIVLVYNSQSAARAAQPVRLPVGLPPGVASWSVTAPDGVTAVTAQLLPASRRDAYLREVYYGAPPAAMHWLAFVAPALPGHGFAAYFLQPAAAPAAAPRTHISAPRRMGAADERISNGVVTLTIAGATGLLAAFADAQTGIALPLTQDFRYYNASTGNCADDGTGGSSWGQAATTYILRPNTSVARDFPCGGGAAAEVEILTGPVLSEARQYLGAGAWLSNVLRLWANASDVESEWTVGPIPKADGMGKEVFMRLTAGGGWASEPAPVLFTDANGLEMQRRQLNARPSWNSTAHLWEPIATNYYPVTARAYIVDAASGNRLTLSPDRAQGCAALAAGELECMMHRRLLFTNFLDNGEALDEPGLNATGAGLVARGTTWLLLDTPARAARAGHAAAVDRIAPPQLLAAPLDAAPPAWLRVPGRAAQFAGVAPGAVPPQLHLSTMQSLGGSELLLRVQHLYEAGEDAALSANATLLLAALLAPPLRIVAAVETSLPGVQPLAQVKPWTLHVTGEPAPVTSPVVPPPPAGADLAVSLAAGEMRTFRCTVETS